LDYVVIPLYEKMYLNASIVHERVKGLVQSGVMSLPEDLVIRVYLTSTRSLKREVADTAMAADLKNILLRLEMPQFVWCADLATPTEYAASETSGRVILDATAGTYERDPWIMWHDQGTIAYKDVGRGAKVEVRIEPYALYRNNLKEIAAC